VEAPGTAPGSDGFIPIAVYRHSRPCGQQNQYKVANPELKDGDNSKRVASAGEWLRYQGERSRLMPIRHNLVRRPYPFLAGASALARALSIRAGAIERRHGDIEG
jgi:hypothetical protein